MSETSINKSQEKMVRITVTVPQKVVEDLREVDRFLAANGFEHGSAKGGVTAAARKVLESGARVFLGHIAVGEVDTLVAPIGTDTLLALRFTWDDLNASRVFAGQLRARLVKIDPTGCVKVSQLEAINTALRNGIATIQQQIKSETPA